MDRVVSEPSDLRRAVSEQHLHSSSPLAAAISVAPSPQRGHVPSSQLHLSVAVGGGRPSLGTSRSVVEVVARRVGDPIPECGPLNADDGDDWHSVRKRAFTRWVNAQLMRRRKCVLRLERDFADGLKLASLVRILSGKKVPHLKKRPVFRSQKIDNAAAVLKFLESELQIKIGRTADGAGIVDGNLDAIFDVLWSLILHYSVTIPMRERVLQHADHDASDRSPTQKFLLWIQGRVPEDIPVHNFTSDWKDGRALGALIDSMAPGLLSDWKDWTPEGAMHNVGEAMTVAQQRLGFFQFLRARDMVAPLVDELSIITYLSQFLTATLLPESEARGSVRQYFSMPTLVEQSHELGGSTSTLASDASNASTATAPTSSEVKAARVAFVKKLRSQKRGLAEAAPSADTATVAGAASSSEVTSAQDPGIAVLQSESTTALQQKTIWETSLRRSSRRKMASASMAMPVKFISSIEAARKKRDAAKLVASIDQVEPTIVAASTSGSTLASSRLPPCVPHINSDFSPYCGFSERMLVW